MVINGRLYYLYADSAFILRWWRQIAFNRIVATLAQNAFNAAVDSDRESIEWSYKDVKQQFTMIDFLGMMKVRKAQIALNYKMSVLLWNPKA